MEQLRNNQEFQDLFLSLKQKGIIRTKEEYLKLMMNITREHFNDLNK